MNPGDFKPVGADSLPTTSEIAPAELSAPVTNTEQFDKWLDQHSDSLANDPNRIYNPADPGDNGLRINVSKFVLVVIGLIFVLSAGSLGAYAAYNALKGQPNNGQQGGLGNVQANILLDTSGRNLHINYDTTIAGGRNFEATGDVLVQNQSPQAFKIQDTGGSNVMVADTKNKTITIGDNPPGQVSLKVNGDITVNGALVSTDSGYSLSGQGLSIGGVLVCTANGCVSSSSPAPTPASPTIDVANLAYLNKTNNFTGINKFTAAGNIFVGDGSGLSALNAGSVSSGTLSDSRLSANVTKNNGNNTFSGSNTFNAQIQAAAGINSVAGYSVNGTAGGSFSCGAGQLLQQAVVSGGIITSGTCVTISGGTTPALQDVYDASAPASIVLSGAGGAFDIQDAASPLATNLFQVGSNGDATLYFAVNNLGISVTGNVNTTGQYQVGGTQISSANLSNDSNLAKLNGNQSFSGNNTFSSASNSFSGNGSGLTNVNAVQLNGQAGSYYTNATNISTGTLSDSRLSNNVALLNALQTFTGANTFNNASNSFSGSGAGLTSLNASNVSSGTLNDLRLSSNVTLAGNTFNGASQLVQLTAGGILPVLNGSNLTSLNASNISSGTLNDSRLSSNVALLSANNIFLGNNSFHLNSTALAVQDAVSPLAGNLFEVTDNTGATKYFEVSASGAKVGGSAICTTAGNCTGVSGGAIGGSGTAGKIAKFTGSGFTVGDSLLSESGSVVAVGGSINIATGNTYQINGSQISSAALSNDSNLAKLDGTQTFSGANTFSNASNSFTGNGAGLSNVDAAKLNGQAGSYYTNANNISSGTLSDSRLSSNVALKNVANTFTGDNVFSLNTAGLAVQDAASPLGTDLFEVTDSTGAAKYFTVSATALQFNGQDVCTAAGNCTGVTGIGGSGTAGKLAKFTGTGTSVGDSLISDNGSTVTVGGVLAVNTITPTATLTIGTPTQTLSLQGDGSTSLSAKSGSFTNTLVFAAPALASHTITIPNATGTVAVSASGPLSLDAAGNLSCPTCLTGGGGGGSGVSSVNTLSGDITLAGTADQVIITPSSNTLTFSLPQSINTTSSPTFANINVTGQYKVNGSQISSSDLSNDSNLAKLDGTQTFTGANSFSNASNSFTGDGAGLTNVDAATLNGQSGSYYTNASNISTGTLNDARLSSNVALLNAGNNFTGTNNFQDSSAAAFQVQSSLAAETLLTVDSTARGVSGGNLVKIGNNTGADTDTTILVVDSALSAPTSNLGVLNGGLFYNSNSGHINVIENGLVKELCNKTDLGCGSAGVATTLAGAYANGASTSDSVLSVDTTRGAVIVKDSSGGIGGTLFGVQSNTGTKYLDVTSAGISTTNLSVAAGGYISIAGGNTASRPGSPTEGMLYYDTTTKSLLVYANGKWQADRSSSTKIVAMGTATGCTGSSPSASLNPDGADYVVTSCTSAQTTINSAITALGAQGGTVYLEEGTYIIDGQINMASNVTLAGAGPGTIIKLKDSAGSVTMINGSSVSRVTIRDLKIDGNGSNEGLFNGKGLAFSNAGSSSTPGVTIKNINMENTNDNGIYFSSTNYNSSITDSVFNNIYYINLTSANNFTISGNVVTGGSYAIWLSGGIRNTISNNKFSGSSNVELYMYGPSNYNTVAHNTIDTTASAAKLYLQGSYNTISNNAITGANGAGINFNNGSNNNTITGNTITGTQYGLWLANISQNTFTGNTITSAQLEGIYLYSTSTYNVFDGNTITGSVAEGFYLQNASNNTIQNNILYNNGGSNFYDGLDLTGSSNSNLITGNQITDTAGSGSAIHINSGSNSNYLSNNSYSGTGASSISDSGTGTLYGNQLTSGGGFLERVGTDSATAFQVQSAGGSESLFTIDTTARSASGGNLIKVGNSTGADSATTILVLDGASAAPTSNLGTLNGGLFYNSGTNHINVIENGVVKELCNKTDLGCGSGATTTLSQAYTNGAGTSDSTISLDSTRGGIIIKDNSTPISGSLFSLQNSGGTTKYLDVSSSKITVGENTIANATATATTATTSGTGTNTTTVTLTAVNSLANGDVIFIDNAGQDYFTRITAGGGTASLTVDPAVTYETGRIVTKYNVQYLGSDGANFSGATRNQNSFYQGYFLGGVVTGAGSTVYSDANIQSAGNLRINTTSGINIQGTNSANALQVQNAAGQQVLAVDTTTNSTKIAQGNLSISGLSIPQTPTLTTSSTGGTLAAATYYYQVAAVNANGSTPAVPSNPTSVTTSGATSQNTLTWTAVANASNYKIYRSTDGTNWKVNTVASTLTSIIDNGTNYTWGTAGAIPTANTTGGNLTVSGTGTFQNSTDSTSAFQVQDSAGDSVLKIDTSNRHIGINNSSPTATLDVVASPPAPDFSFGFEDGTFGAFTPAGGWSIISGTAHTGSFSARDVSDQSSLTLTKSIASAGTISFYMIDNSGSTFKIDGVSQAITYNPSFTYFSFPISAGSHTFAWRPGTGGFEFLMYVDDVSITENAPTSYAALFNGGSVGIGTSAPAATLETDGTALFKTSNLSATDFQVQNGTGGNILSAGYGSLSTAVINDNMTTNTPTGTLKNSATYSAGNYVQLNPASGNTNGEIEYRPSLSGTGNWKANFEFFAGGGTGADSTFLYAYSNSTPTGEGSATGGYQIYFDEFTNTIALNFNGSDLATFSSGNIDNSTWHTAEVDKAGTNFKVYYDGTKIIDYTDISRTLAGPLWGFGARSGGSTDNHRVRNFVLSDNYFTGNQTNVNANSLFQAQTDNQYLFRIQNAAGTNILNSDSTNMQISLQSNLTLSDLSAPTLPGVAAGANTGGALSGAAGTTYYYKVTALSGKGESLSSSEVSINGQSFTKLSAPAAPTGVPAAGTEMGIGAYLYKLTVVTANGETTAGTESAAITTTSSNQEVTLTIPAVPTGATGYKVYRTVVGGASGTEKLITAGGCSGTVSATSCTDNATDAQANGSNPPASNTATTNLNNATVSWTSVSGATAYRVYRGTAAGAESAYQTAAGSPFTDTGAAGTTAAIPTRSTVAQLGIGTSAPAANLDVEGTALFKPAQDSTTAFQVQNASGNGLLSIGNNGAGSTTYINDNMTTNPPTGTLLNNATYSAGNYVQLNDGTSGVNGEVDYTPGISAMGSYAAQFDIWYSAGFLSGNSIYFYAGNSAVPTADTATNGGYIVDFDDHSLVAQLKYNNSVLASTSISLANSTWYTVKIVKAGTNIKVYFNGAKLIDFTDIGRAMPGTHWGLGAWSNPWSYIHRVRNFTLSQDNSINIVSVGNSGAGTTILQADNTPVDPSTGLSSLNGGIYYNSTTNKLMSIQNGQVQGFATSTSVTKVVAMGLASGCTGSSPVASADTVADYVVTSCTSAQTTINTAISALGAAGGTVYLKEGTYIIDGSINLANNVTLAGSGYGTILKLKDGINAGVNLISGSSVNRVGIRDMKLDGNKTNNTSGIQIAFKVNTVGSGASSSAVPGFKVNNVFAENFRNNAVSFSNSSANSSISNSTFLNNSSDAINGIATVTNLVINGNTLQGNGGNGIYLNGSDTGVTISGNLIEGNTSDGIFLGAGSTNKNNTVSGNSIINNGGHGFNAQSAIQLAVTSNNISSNTGDGIHLLAADKSSFSANTLAQNGSDGIDTNGGNYNSFSSNSIVSNTANGINMIIDNNSTISGNNISNNTSSGISIGVNGANNETISGNNISGNGSSGIVMQGSSTFTYQNSITGNTINANSSYGISLSNGPSYNTISDNKLYNNTGSGSNSSIDISAAITTLASDGNIISNNTINDTAGTGFAISLGGTGKPTNTYLSGNTFSGTGASSISDNGTNTIYANQVNANGDFVMEGQRGVAIGSLAASSSLSLQGALTTTALTTVAQPAVTKVGTAGTTTWGYKITALDGLGETAASTEQTISTGNATLDGTNYNTITWTPVGGAINYKIYRTTAGGTPNTTGLIGTVAGNITTFNDTGIAATTAAPASNTSGGISVQGNATFKPTTDSTSAFQVQDAAGSSMLTVDTNNKYVQIGSTVTDATAVLSVLDSYNNGTDPAGTNGAMYYNTSLNAFRCFQNGTWVNCAGSGTSTLSASYTAGSAPADQILNLSAADGGGLILKDAASSVGTAFQVQTNGGANILSVDGTNLRVNVGSIGTAAGQLYVSGKVPSAVLGSVSLSAADAVYTQGKFAYVTAQGTNLMYIYDVSNPASPVLQSSIGTGLNQPSAVFVQGKYAYVVTSFGNFVIFDVSNPHVPVSVGSTTNGLTNATSIYVQGRYAYVDSQSTSAFVVYDVSNPANIVKVGSITSGLNNPLGMYVQGRYAYVADYTNNSLDIIDVNNPASPTKVGSSSANLSQPYDVYVVGRYAYVASYFNNKLAVFDVSDPTAPTGVTSVAAGTTPRAVYVQGRYAYLGTTDGVTLYDISNPASPVNSGTFTTSVGTSNGLMVQGRYVYLANQNNSQFQILDTGGAYAQQLEAGGVETGTLQVDANGSVAGDFNVQGGLSVGQSLQVNGNIGASGQALFQNAVNSSNQFQVQNSGGGSLLNVDSVNSNINMLGNNSGELQAWQTNTNSLPAARNDAGTVIANGYIYVVGGGASGNNTVYYSKLNSNGSTRTFTTSGNNLPVTRKFAATVTVNGYIYILGGSTDGTSGQAQSTVYYAKLNSDGSIGTWKTNANALPLALFQGSAVTANGFVYFIGGADTTNTSQNTVYYAKLNADGSTGAWTNSPNTLAQTRIGAATVVANGYVYVSGGGASGTNTVYYAKLNSDGSTSAFSTNTNNLPASRGYAGSVVANGYIYLIGGASGPTNTVFYAQLNANGSTGAWSTAANNLPGNRDEFQAAVSNGYVYAVGGYDGATAQSSVYYASLPRVTIGGSLDLVGLQGQTLSDPGSASTGSTGGSITAGNIMAVGTLQVQGQGSFAQGITIGNSISVGGSALFQNASDSTTAFQIQNASGSSIFNVDTTNGLATINGSSASPLTVTTSNTNASISLTTGTGSISDSGFINVNGRAVFGYDGNNQQVLLSDNGSNKTIVLKGGAGLQFADTSGTSGVTFNLAAGGATTFKTKTNSATGFQIQNASGTSVLAADTINGNVTLGNNSSPYALSLPGASGAYASTPDSASNSITGDIDLRARVALNDWTPAASNNIIGKHNTNLSYQVSVLSTGQIQLAWSTDGSTAITKQSTVAPTVTDGQSLWIRVILDVDNGAAGNDVKFYTAVDSPGIPTAWTQLGTTVTTAGTTSIFDSAEPVEIGSYGAGTSNIAAGKFYRALIYSGIDGTLKNDFDPTIAATTSSTTFSAVTGETWTRNGAAAFLANSAATFNSNYVALNNQTSIRSNTNSIAALQVQNNSGSAILNVDTSAGQVCFNSGAYGNTNCLYGDSGYNLRTQATFSVQYGGAQQVDIGYVNGNAGLAFGSAGDVQLYRAGAGQLLLKPTSGNDSAAAFQVQDSGGAGLLNIDTSSRIITFAGDTTTFITIRLDNAHFKSTQTTAPTIGTPGNCGTSPTAAIASGSTDSAGSFRVTSGTGGGYTTCDTVITFNKAYGAAPKSIMLVAETKDGGTGTAAARQVYVSNTSATTFTIKFNSNPAGDSEQNWYYYWVVE